jgi:DNA sulfur modification protein DndD
VTALLAVAAGGALGAVGRYVVITRIGAQASRSRSASPSDTKVKTAEAEITRLETEIEKHQHTITEADNLLPSLDSERDEIVQRLGGGGEGTVAMVADLLLEEERFRSEAERRTDELMKLLASDVSLALAGADLREAAIARMCSEEIREKWISGRNQGNVNLDRYLADLSDRLGRLEPPVTGDRRDEVVAAAREAWHALWHPAPEGSAEDYLHSGLMGVARGQAIERLEEVGSRSAEELTTLVAQIRTSIDTAESKKRERLAIEQNAPETERLSERLKVISEEVGGLRSQRDGAQRNKDALDGELATRRQELGRHVESQGRGAPSLRRASQAEAAATLIDEILKDAIPTQVNLVANAMTKAWKSMAQMSDRVERIEISPDCEVKILNKRGENLHEIEKSAGASQVFTQSLIWAITNVSGEDFPFIVDTPLARLSRDHRLGVLRTFLDRKGQVILLSTDEEVVDDKLDAIRDRIAAAYQLRIRSDDGVAVTTVEQDTI